MEALLVILFIYLFVVVCVFAGNSRFRALFRENSKKEEKSRNEKQAQIIVEESSDPLERGRFLPTAEKKKLKRQWKQAQINRLRMNQEQDRAEIDEISRRMQISEQINREIRSIQKGGRLGKDFAVVSKIEQNRRLYELRRSVSAIKRKYGDKAALNFLRTYGRIDGVASTTKPSKPFTQERQTDKSGWVYVIQDKSTGLYKIGRSKNIERRLKELGVGNTARLVQRKLVADCYAVEKAAHQRYKAHRLPQSEYFKLSSPPFIGS